MRTYLRAFGVAVVMGVIGCTGPAAGPEPGAISGAGADMATAPGTGGGDAGAPAEDLAPTGCKNDNDCLGELPETTPANCAVATCDVVAHLCHFVAIDHDGDGHATADCKAKGVGSIEVGDDCNDGDAKTYPGAWDGPVGDGHSNACDGVDNDCNKSVDDAKLQNGGFCACTPGATRSCAADGKLGTCAGGTETCGADAKWGACSIQPAAKDSCLPNNDDDCDGNIREGCLCPGLTPPNLGTACGSCGGTVQCDSSCSIPTPGNLGAACNSCGGVVQCNGTCSTSQPGNLGAGCGSCGGTVQCNGACSIPTPGNLGAGCNSCGGVVQCNGSCSTSQPGNLGQGCGACGGTVQCNGACSKDTPGNLGQVQDYSFNQERFSCCFIDYYKTFGGACHGGWNYSGVQVDKISGGGSCDVVAQGGGGDCTVRVHFHNNGTEGAICNITVKEQRVCD